MRVPSSMKFALSRSLWHGRSSIGSARQGELDAPAHRRARARTRAGSDASRRGQGAIRLDDPERDEQARDRAVRRERDGSNRRCGAMRLGPVDRLVTDRRALDEPGHEVALRPDEGRHLGPDADAGRGDRRGVLDLAADAEEMGVVAGQADDIAVVAVRRRDEEVAVRDPARQGSSASARGRPAPEPSASRRRAARAARHAGPRRRSADLDITMT